MISEDSCDEEPRRQRSNQIPYAYDSSREPSGERDKRIEGGMWVSQQSANSSTKLQAASLSRMQSQQLGEKKLMNSE